MKRKADVKLRVKKRDMGRNGKGRGNVQARGRCLNACSVVAADFLLLLSQIFQRYAAQIILNDLLQPAPERQRGAAGRPRARILVGSRAGKGQEGAFRQFQDIFRSIFARMPGKAVSAGLSPEALDESRFKRMAIICSR